MQNTSSTWKRLASSRAYHAEWRLTIGGYTYGIDRIADIRITKTLMQGFTIGNANCGELYCIIDPAGSIPKAAEINVEIRCVANDEASEWLPMGTFWIDSRKRRNDGLLEITAFDAMARVDQTWIDLLPNNLQWPVTMPDAVNAIADSMGIDIDSRVELTSYYVEYPNELTMREVLQQIGAAHGGSWYITAENKLMLSRLKDFPKITNYLTDEYGNVLDFGGVKIIV